MEYQFESLGPTLRILVLIFLIAFALLALSVIVVLAALPGRVAKAHRHPQAEAINVCGWLGLPTGFLWVLALVWAYMQRNTVNGTGRALPEDDTEVTKQLAALENAIAALETASKGEKQ